MESVNTRMAIVLCVLAVFVCCLQSGVPALGSYYRSGQENGVPQIAFFTLFLNCTKKV